MKKGEGKKLSPVTRAEAVQIFQSAIAYLQEAGIRVRGGNTDAGMTLEVPGVEWEQGRLIVSKGDGERPGVPGLGSKGAEVRNG
jgi:hypothetical protein